MDREAIREAMEWEFSEILAEAVIDLDGVLDAVEAVFASHNGLAVSWAPSLAAFFLLRRARHAFAVLFDVGIEGDSYRLEQLYKHVKELFDEAYGLVRWLVEPEGIGVQPVLGEPMTVHAPFLTSSETDALGVSGLRL